MAGGYDPSGQNINPSPEATIARQKIIVQECREMMFMEHLDSLENGTIPSMDSVRLLNFCGDDIPQKMRQRVQGIKIIEEDLSQSDQLLVGLMIKRLSPLKTVFIQQITLDPSMILFVKDWLKCVDLFEAGYEIMDSVKDMHFADVMTILNQSKLLYVRLRCDDDVKLLFLSDWMEGTQVQLDNLGLLKITRVDILRNLFKFLSTHSLSHLLLNINPRITGSQFTDIVSSHGSKTTKVFSISIEDKSVTTERIEAYLHMFVLFQSKRLILSECDLTEEDVSMIKQCCRRHGVESVRMWRRNNTRNLVLQYQDNCQE